MSLSRLIIQNFRNISSAELDLSPNFNFIVGHNGSGKTSLLEAIFYLGHGRSFKSHISNRVINYEAEDFVLHGKIDEEKHSWTVGLQSVRAILRLKLTAKMAIKLPILLICYRCKSLLLKA
jgi:DNA replication and repair protein RecF